jgi:vacuolar-type H+-ATPase subunit F/Vma7
MALTAHIVCRPALAPGFELAGARVHRASDAAAARTQLAELAREPAVGIVLVDEALHRALPAEWLRRLERQARPLVVSFPGPRAGAAAGAAEEALLEILRRAIGYRVRLP